MNNQSPTIASTSIAETHLLNITSHDENIVSSIRTALSGNHAHPCFSRLKHIGSIHIYLYLLIWKSASPISSSHFVQVTNGEKRDTKSFGTIVSRLSENNMSHTLASHLDFHTSHHYSFAIYLTCACANAHFSLYNTTSLSLSLSSLISVHPSFKEQRE
jgi:hypothetical protein